MTLARLGVRLTSLTTTVRLVAAAALCVVPLGLVWSRTSGTVTPGIVGPPVCDANGDCDPGIYTPGSYVPGSTIHVAQSPARVFLIGAAIALIAVAMRVRTAATLRIARLAAVSVTIAGVLAVGARAVPALICTVLALALLLPAIGPRRSPTP